MSDFLIDINPDMELPKYSLALHKLNEEPLSSLKNIKDIHYKAFFVGIDELSFNVPYHRMENNGDLVKNEIYGMVEGDHLIKLNDTKFFIVSAVNEKANEENGEKYKEVICYSREYELSQKKLVDYVADSRVLYDRHDTMLDGLEKGILNYIFNRITKSWTIGYVDPNVLLKDDKDVHRALNFSDSNLLQVFQELQKAFGCIFKFDTIEQKINVYAVESKTIQGQHRGLYISDRNFIKNIEKSIKSDEIKTRLYLYGKDNISIQSISPVGQPYIDNFDFYKSTKYMSQGLIDALNVYESKVESTNPDFKPLLENLQQANGVMEDLINADHISDLDKKGLIALERYLSNIQTLIDVKTEELAINQSQIDKATGANLTALYDARKEIQALLSGYNADKVNVNNFISTKKQQINSQQVIIDGIESNLRALQDGLDVESTSNFTKEQLRELDKFIRVETYNNSDYTEHNIHELYEEGKKTLTRISQPAIQFDVDVVDFLSVVECQHVWDKFVKGDIVTLEHKEIGFNHDVRFISYEHDEGGNTLNLKFSNKNSFDDATLYLQELLEDFKTTGTIVDFNKDKWGQVGEVKSEIATLIDSKLEEARQNILNAVGQRYLHDDSGLWLYKENPDGAIDPAQIRGINSDIVLTDDNFASVKTAISAKNGINAELIRGKIGEFAEVRANQIIVGSGGETIPDDVLGDNIVKQGESYNGTIIDEQSGIVVTRGDDKVKTSLNATDGIKIQGKINGVWQDNFYVDTNGFIRAKNIIIDGLDSGNKIFNSTPTTPYILNDLWKVTGIAGVDFKICTTARASGNYVASDWTNVTNNKDYADTIKNLTSGTSLSGGITTIDRNRVRVEHPGGQYSEVRADGFVRKWEYGEAKYLNDVWVGTFSYANFPNLSSPPSPVEVVLPRSFRGRESSVEIVLSFNDLFTRGGNANDYDRVTWLTVDSKTRLRVSSKNFNATDPVVYIDSYVEAYFKGRENDWRGERRYNRAGFTIIIIGK